MTKALIVSGLFGLVCERIALGDTLTEVCQELDISPSAFYDTYRGDPKLHQEFLQAKETGAEALADRLQHVDRYCRDAGMAGVLSTNWRWLLAKRTQKYGDKSQGEDKHAADLTAVLQEAIARIPRPAGDQAKVINSQATELVDLSGEGPTDS
ncbi:MAG: hypothetical protein Q8P46_06925 [Hyphomicrobiales bacterium]|nr:hypothetical protein [Hyphomicrobiales bacterium]